MMRKALLSVLLSMIIAGAQAVPAKRGIWRTLQLADGTQVYAELHGDEYMPYYKTANGKCFVLNGQSGLYEPASLDEIQKTASEGRMASNADRLLRAAKRTVRKGARTTVQHKGIVILVEFSDVKFISEDAQALYNDVLNKDNYSSSLGFVGSVRDYFRDQSDGNLLLDFDVVGPVCMPNGYAYYGANTGIVGGDAHPDEMVETACRAIADKVNFADYDWDGDGEADQICILYAGHGEASGGNANTIWPHESKLTRYGRNVTINGTKIDTYACSCELNQYGTIDGIGTFCHEFSHCLGIPDMYDTSGKGNYGMYRWDIMSYGNYNGDSFIPSAYTSYERWIAGWIEPVELTDDTEISGMKPLEEGGTAYIIYNDDNLKEYYLLENRSKTRWDAAQAGEGLLVVHVDYDENVWQNNQVNSGSSNHQRLTVIAADNSYEANDEDAAGDVYPYKGNNSLTNSTTPSATVYNRKSNGSYYMDKAITDITRNTDGTISFTFTNNTAEEPHPDASGNWFYESFDKCAGIGGNDGKWGNASTGGFPEDFTPDNEGWQGNNRQPSKQCAKVTGEIKSPLFYFNDGAVLTFKAAPCNGYDTNLTLSADMGTLSQTTFTMSNGEWTEFRVTLSGKGYTQLSFMTSGVYFIDEVRVIDPTVSEIRNMVHPVPQPDNQRIYDIDGRYMGNDLDRLGKGIYIMNGKKVVK